MLSIPKYLPRTGLLLAGALSLATALTGCVKPPILVNDSDSPSRYQPRPKSGERDRAPESREREGEGEHR